MSDFSQWYSRFWRGLIPNPLPKDRKWFGTDDQASAPSHAQSTEAQTSPTSDPIVMSNVRVFSGLNRSCPCVRTPRVPRRPVPLWDAPSEMTYFSWLSAAEGSFISGALCGATELCLGPREQANWTLLCNEALLTHARTHTGRGRVHGPGEFITAIY